MCNTDLSLGCFRWKFIIYYCIKLLGEKNNYFKNRMQEISSQDTVDFIKNNSNLVIVDVRTQGEFEAGHIKGALNIDVNRPDFKEKIGGLDKNKKYLVYCRSGNRSKIAGRIMESMGFKEVYDLAGGIVDNADLLQ